MNKVILIDGNSLIFRGYYASIYAHNQNYQMKTSSGQATNALSLFIRMVKTIIAKHEHSHLLVLFDTGKPTFRKEINPNYKSSRKKAPDDLAEQFSYVYEFLDAANIKYESRSGYEADDLIGSYAKQFQAMGNEVKIFTGDKDLLQLVDKKITVNILVKGASLIDKYTPNILLKKTGLNAVQYMEYMALAGDPSDDIKGLPGVGEKTATQLLLTFGSVENITKNIGQIKSLKLRQTVADNLESLATDLKLVKILTDLPLNFTIDDLIYDQILNNSKLDSFYQKYELKSQLQLRPSEQSSSYNTSASDEVTFITSAQELSMALSKTVTILLTLTDQNYHRGQFVNLAIYNGSKKYIITELGDTLKQVFNSYFTSSTNFIVTYNFKQLYNFFLNRGIDIKCDFFDVMIANYLLDPDHGAASLEELGDEYNLDLVKYKTILDAKDNTLLFKTLETHFFGQQVAATFELYNMLREKLKTQELEEVMTKIENPVCKVLAKMEITGLGVCYDTLLDKQQKYQKLLDHLQEKIYELANCEFNIQSPKQLQEVLFTRLNITPPQKKTTLGYATDQETLEQIANHHPIIEVILNYRRVAKILYTYLDGFAKELYPDHRLHTIYTQTITRTGRLSSVSPNLQNIPSRDFGTDIKQMFIPTNDLFISFDYSQVELRVLAHISKSKTLIDLFQNEADIHSATAKEIFDTEFPTQDQRRVAKAVNFGLIYGLTSFGLSRDLKIPLALAKSYLDKHQRTYPQVHEYMQKIIQKAQQDGFVKTLFGRKRILDYSSLRSKQELSQQDRLALNAPIQGTAADLIKLAMIKINNFLETKKLQTKLIMQIHDELIFDCPACEQEIIETEIPKIMNSFSLVVPLSVNIQKGKDLRFEDA